MATTTATDPPPTIIPPSSEDTTLTTTSPLGSPSTQKKTLKGDLKRLLNLYHHALVNKPITTKSLTSAIISALGDLLASRSSGKGNLRRTLAFFLFGGCITGPVCHYWYGFLESKLKSLQGAKNITAKVILDKLFFTPPFLAVTLFTLRLLESGKAGAAWAGTKSVYVPTLKTNLKVWTVAQAINFTYVPPMYRVLFGNVVALWWSFYLSRNAGGGGGKGASSVVLSRKTY